MKIIEVISNIRCRDRVAERNKFVSNATTTDKISKNTSSNSSNSTHSRNANQEVQPIQSSSSADKAQGRDPALNTCNSSRTQTLSSNNVARQVVIKIELIANVKCSNNRKETLKPKKKKDWRISSR